MNWSTFITPILLSLKVTLLSSVIVFVLATLVAWLMTKRSIKGRVIIETLFMLPLVLPPTVVGFLLLVLLGRRSVVGRAMEWLFNQPIVFTWGAAVIASVVVAFPLVYQTAKVGFQSIDRDLEDAGRSIGANEWQVLRWITLPLAWRALLSGFLLGFARGLGEFGATLMIAGNIPGKTQTVSTAIYLAVDTGNLTLAWTWSLALVLISFFMLLLTYRKPVPYMQ